MKNLRALAVFSLVFSLVFPLVWTQDRASMTAPVVKPTPEEVVMTVRFNDFNAGNEYRIGVGTATAKIPNVKIELLKNDAPISKNLASFEQGFAQHWWNIDKVVSQGFALTAPDFPKQDEKLSMRVTVPKAEADKLKKIYLFISKKYAEDRWYIEDGVELTDAHW